MYFIMARGDQPDDFDIRETSDPAQAIQHFLELSEHYMLSVEIKGPHEDMQVLAEYANHNRAAFESQLAWQPPETYAARPDFQGSAESTVYPFIPG